MTPDRMKEIVALRDRMLADASVSGEDGSPLRAIMDLIFEYDRLRELLKLNDGRRVEAMKVQNAVIRKAIINSSFWDA